MLGMAKNIIDSVRISFVEDILRKHLKEKKEQWDKNGRENIIEWIKNGEPKLK